MVLAVQVGGMQQKIKGMVVVRVKFGVLNAPDLHPP